MFLLRRSLSLVPCSFQGGLCQDGLCLGGVCPAQSEKRAVCVLLECFLVTTCKQSLRRLCFHRCLSVYRRGVSVSAQGGLHPRGVSVQGGLHLRSSLSGGLCPGGSLSQRSLSGVSVQGVPIPGGLCLRGLCPGGLCSGGLCLRDLCPGGLCLGGSLTWRPPIRYRADGTHPTGMHSC